jgi:HD-GYP domain-containing protein (c-di-GMP phosphodiesterase class II)
LARNHLRVPDQIAVTGFDKIDISGYLNPPLTTVKIPIYGQGWTSAKLLLDLLEGRPVPQKTYLPTRLVVRESCRCVPNAIPLLESEKPGARRSGRIKSRSLEEQFPFIHETIRSRSQSGISGDIENPDQNPIQDLPQKSSREKPESMVKQLEVISSRSDLEDFDYETLENMLFEVWRNRTFYAPGRKAAIRNEDLLFENTMKLGHKVIQHEWNRVNEFLQERQKLELIRELLIFNDIPKQMNVLARRMPEMGISGGYLSLYKGDPPEDRQQAVCVLGIRDLHRLGTDVEGMDFPSNQLVPDDFLSGGKQRFMIVVPLKQYGFFLFEINPESNRFAAFLGDIISGALQAGFFFQQLETQKDGLTQSLENVRKTMAGFIQTMSSMVEVRDPYTAGHQRRVSDLARTIAQQMNLTPVQIEGVRVAGIIHDLGKLYIPAEILNRAGPLDDVEWSMIKKHPKVAYDILKTIDFPWPIGDAVFQHHERLDGSGYPNGLTADDICLEARILAVADVVEAMSSHRPYREALGEGRALEEINEHRGALYDPAVVDACTDLLRNKGFKFKTTNYFSPSKR